MSEKKDKPEIQQPEIEQPEPTLEEITPTPEKEESSPPPPTKKIPGNPHSKEVKKAKRFADNFRETIKRITKHGTK